MKQMKRIKQDNTTIFIVMITLMILMVVNIFLIASNQYIKVAKADGKNKQITTNMVNSQMKAYSKSAYTINNPTKWPENTEIELEDGVYGYRFVGVATKDNYRQDYQCSSAGERPTIIKYGGQIDASPVDGAAKISAQGYMWNTSNYLIPVIVSYPNNIRLQVAMTNEHDNTPYDIWVTYTK